MVDGLSFLSDSRQVTGTAPSALRLLLPFLRRYTWQGFAAAFCLLAASGLVLLLGQAVRRLVDGGLATGSQARLDATALGVATVIAALAAATSCRFALVTWLGERVGADLRRAVFDHITTLSPAWFETARTGDVLSRLVA
ncbi:MAG: ABC transporter transmembrane domain-containing protein, partial [Janthinobacterium lividum]